MAGTLAASRTLWCSQGIGENQTPQLQLIVENDETPVLFPLCQPSLHINWASRDAIL